MPKNTKCALYARRTSCIYQSDQKTIWQRNLGYKNITFRLYMKRQVVFGRITFSRGGGSCRDRCPWPLVHASMVPKDVGHVPSECLPSNPSLSLLMVTCIFLTHYGRPYLHKATVFRSRVMVKRDLYQMNKGKFDASIFVTNSSLKMQFQIKKRQTGVTSHSNGHSFVSLTS